MNRCYRIHPNFSFGGGRSVKVKITLSKTSGIDGKQLCLSAFAFNSSKKHKVKSTVYALKEGCKEYEFVYQLGSKALLWSDLQPALYQLKAEINDVDDRLSVSDCVTLGLSRRILPLMG